MTLHTDYGTALLATIEVNPELLLAAVKKLNARGKGMLKVQFDLDGKTLKSYSAGYKLER